jgi:hypothetical protein
VLQCDAPGHGRNDPRFESRSAVNVCSYLSSRHRKIGRTVGINLPSNIDQLNGRPPPPPNSTFWSDLSAQAGRHLGPKYTDQSCGVFSEPRKQEDTHGLGHWNCEFESLPVQGLTTFRSPTQGILPSANAPKQRGSWDCCDVYITSQLSRLLTSPPTAFLSVRPARTATMKQVNYLSKNSRSKCRVWLQAAAEVESGRTDRKHSSGTEVIIPWFLFFVP